jgi:hypothetical protein
MRCSWGSELDQINQDLQLRLNAQVHFPGTKAVLVLTSALDSLKKQAKEVDGELIFKR